ncbi:methionine ABC transporter ATP-binding protein [Latilactobacillus graminis]|uniref:Methionine import ATP-binding protein MetN 2 n=2 Tax=Latilactobacillus graminis TaxID=60519 RepID=A0AA89KX67_9LACO|nr:methionine ABC transporter ATP-binding protein [Latilactobacillus graminis]KRM22355.1 methionine import ATP-binding protein MetN 2 [Latilactobacillus graminis DSM 20719]QFP79471.1 methionine ABC transporter ATP-binding protein [Latilactobacillus graminis]
MLQLKQVGKTFIREQKTFAALTDVSLNIEAGEIYGIIGYSGAGKSTLMRLLNGLEKPTTGDVLVEGQSIVGLSEQAMRPIRQKIGMIFQHFNLLWSKTVLENIMLPLKLAGVPKAQRQAKARELLKVVELTHLEAAYPSELSGGQKQRVAIARALISDPKILLCDEATSALDPKTTNSILTLLAQINREMGITIVLVTHEMEAVRRICQRIAVMENGRLIEEGTVHEIFEKPKTEATQALVAESLMVTPSETAASINQLLERVPNGTIVQLRFNEAQSSQPVIGRLMRQYPTVEISVISGSLQQTINGALGYLYIQIQANPSDLKAVLAELAQQTIEVEVVRHG